MNPTRIAPPNGSCTKNPERPEWAPYRAPRSLPGGHLQTIWPACFAPRPPVDFTRERWPTPDGDFIDLDWCGQTIQPPPHGPWVVLLHGLEGNAHSHYARALMHEVLARGHTGVVIHFRGCGGTPNHAPRSYHSGDSPELDWIVRRLLAKRLDTGHTGPLWVVGVSLGGNVLLKWLGEQGPSAPGVDAAAAVSTPQDLHAAACRLNQGFSQLYQHHFLRSLRAKALRLWNKHPGLFDRERVRQARTLFEFDDSFTAPVHGFAGALDYWKRCSSRPWLKEIAVPTLVLNAQNDPFLPASALATPEQVAPWVTLEYPTQGGHVGFPTYGPNPLR